MHYKDYTKEQRKKHDKIDHGYILQYCDGVDEEYFKKYFNDVINVDIFIKKEYLDILLNNRVKIDNLNDQKLSTHFYKKYKNKLNLSQYLIHQKLSENDIIDDIIDDITKEGYLDILFIYQVLLESFLRSIKKHRIDNIFLKLNIVNYNKLSDEFRKEFSLDDYLYINNWLYKSTKFKKEQLIEYNLYKCFDDYFIAYKAIRPDRYSLYNFQYQYFKDGIYQAKADYNINNKDLFGLSVGLKEYCKDYGDGRDSGYIIVKCKVYYDDIDAIVHNGDKVRCTKIQILD